MKFLASALAATIAAASIVLTARRRRPAQRLLPGHDRRGRRSRRAGAPGHLRVLLDFDAGDTASVRMRIDSATTRYAVDFNDIGPIGNAGVRARRYFVMPRRTAPFRWIESTA